MNKNLLIALTAINLVAVIAIISVVVWVALPGTSPIEEAVDEITNEPASEESTQEPSGRVIQVSGDEYSFSPNTINVTAGEAVVIEFTNSGNMQHDFVVDVAEGITLRTPVIGPGETTSLHVDIPSGVDSFAFYCSVAGHRELGMEGGFVIE
ncbi:MAG: hypothetical protein A2919_02045 [Candidatus Spechtbacteria bacterium RIFCSPLOWO2_01_FULL_43_12]|uniref:EfeO-type cupredoxin-like domain-containing protein n=1 Tax=Candidatus Spechtbacteria bacterium RIFCSPLOWO2_01_FULL_43_12 TaxID=1802162 RepID=A0A1G2HEE2_9BACT|nr:MAG: hypothetical protein A2919_02045 [Candidatus Spechtbacteria bacterium RIFCSPLOWO2_01_FULL_43_12]